MRGWFAVSRAGHDKGQMYIIIREDGDYAYVADGRIRTLENPKKKKMKHLQVIKTDLDAALVKKLEMQQTVYNEEIKYAIKVRNKEVVHVKG